MERMNTGQEFFNSEQQELNALRKAVELMGFDPTRLAMFVSNSKDSVCQSILLSSFDLNESKLQEQGGRNVNAWVQVLSHIQLQQ